jgi:hypothetical protein
LGCKLQPIEARLLLSAPILAALFHFSESMRLFLLERTHPPLKFLLTEALTWTVNSVTRNNEQRRRELKKHLQLRFEPPVQYVTLLKLKP